MLKAEGMLGRVRSDIGKARSASSEDLLVAGLVAAPFAGAFGIWLSQLTWWPNLIIMLIWLAAQVFGTLWVAGHVRADAEDVKEDAAGDAEGEAV